MGRRPTTVVFAAGRRTLFYSRFARFYSGHERFYSGFGWNVGVIRDSRNVIQDSNGFNQDSRGFIQDIRVFIQDARRGVCFHGALAFEPDGELVIGETPGPTVGVFKLSFNRCASRYIRHPKVLFRTSCSYVCLPGARLKRLLKCAKVRKGRPSANKRFVCRPCWPTRDVFAGPPGRYVSRGDPANK